MYAAAFGGDKSVKKSSVQMKDKLKGKPRHATAFKRETKDEEDLIHKTTIGGYAGGKKTRVTDRFVRYPYPKTMGTTQQRAFKDRNHRAVTLN